MKTKKFIPLDWLLYVFIPVIMLVSFSACGTSVYILEYTTGIGTSVKQENIATRRGKKVGTKQELKYNRLSNGMSGDGKIEQGERVELETTVNNKGKLEALNTMLKVTTSRPLVRIEPESKSIGTLPENTTSDPMRFTLTIPRGVPAGALPIMLEVTQTDFPAVTKTLEYTI